MATVTFDTQKYADTLLAAGVPAEQVRAFVNAHRDSLADALDSSVATKSDVVALERRFDALDAKLDKLDARIEGRITLLQWMLGIVIGGVVMIVLKAYFPL